MTSISGQGQSFSLPQGENCTVKVLKVGDTVKEVKELNADQIKAVQEITQEAIGKESSEGSKIYLCNVKIGKGQDASEVTIFGATTKKVKYTSQQYQKLMKVFHHKESQGEEINLLLQVMAKPEPKQVPNLPKMQHKPSAPKEPIRVSDETTLKKRPLPPIPKSSTSHNVPAKKPPPPPSELPRSKRPKV